MPQPGGDYFIIITCFLVLICFLDLTKAASYQMENYDLDMDSGGISNSSNEEEFYGGLTSLERPISWLRSANSMMGSPAGHVVMQVAKELLHRSAGNSQVGQRLGALFYNFLKFYNSTLGPKSEPHQSADHHTAQSPHLLSWNARSRTLECLWLWPWSLE